MDEKKLNEIIAYNVNALLEEQNKLKGKFEDSVGVSRGFFSRLARGEGILTLYDYLQICDELNVRFDVLTDANTADEVKARELDAMIEEKEAELEKLRKEREAIW